MLQVDDMTLADQDTAADVGGRGAQLPPVDLQLLLKEAAGAGALAPLDLVLEKIEILQGVSDQAGRPWNVLGPVPKLPWTFLGCISNPVC